MRLHTVPFAVFALLSLPGAAFALAQPDHQIVSARACAGAGLPETFCLSVGRAAYDTDSESWEDPIAHAQTPEGGDACVAADAAAARLAELGTTILAALNEGVADSDQRSAHLADAARDLGRALHTLEDDCAHAGMPNPQHAYLTDSDVCRGTHESPDIQPEAIACAIKVADGALAAFAAAVITAGLDPSQLADASPTDWTRYPPLGEVCDFMQSAPAWDGVDRRWNNDIVLPHLASALSRALDGDSAPPATVCPNGPADIARAAAPVFDTSARSSCAITEAFCLGGEVTRTDVMPPFYNQDGVRALLGCSVGRAAPGSLNGTLAALLGWLALRFRRRGKG